MPGTTPPLLMVTRLFGDREMESIFSEERSVNYWLQTEAALALAQARAGVISQYEAEAIAAACLQENIDLEVLWKEARNVGYPILSLVRQIAGALPPGPNGRVHYGATTQDIMDTGLALQLRDALARLEELCEMFGAGLAGLVETHRHTVMAARTHDQQAVPTTFGTKLAPFLGELARHRQRLGEARSRLCLVSLFGAGGTSAAMGVSAPRVREYMAALLGLGCSHLPWHVARDTVAEFGQLCALMSGTCARFARDVIGLSRTEIGEVQEQFEHHRGASSTMPQKTNPIGSEAIIGMASTAGALTSALYRAMEPEHERAAGEWQVEWQVLPQLACLAAGCLLTAAEVVGGLQVFPESMYRNLQADSGLVMAEAYMITLAPFLGREKAHDLVYEAALRVRREGGQLETVLGTFLDPEVYRQLQDKWPVRPEDYIGDPDLVCNAALDLWEAGLKKKEQQV